MKKEDNRCFTIDGTKLKNKRQEMNLTQEKLAQITNPNIDVSTLRRNEHPGPHNMFVATVVAIATALHCAPTELFYEDTTLSSAADEPVCERDIFKADQEDTGSDALITTELHMLTLSPYADEPLKMASAGLLKASGSRERVSVSIASIAGYMRSIIWRAPALMNHVQGLIDATTSALSASKLDDESTILALRTGLKNNMAELRGIEGLPVHAKMESELVVGLLVRSQMTNDVAEQLRAVKVSMYWLRDNWQYVCHKQAAYYAWSDICCMLTGAPVDYFTRSSIMEKVNEFALYVSLLDPVYAMSHN